MFTTKLIIIFFRFIFSLKDNNNESLITNTTSYNSTFNQSLTDINNTLFQKIDFFEKTILENIENIDDILKSVNPHQKKKLTGKKIKLVELKRNISQDIEYFKKYNNLVNDFENQVNDCEGKSRVYINIFLSNCFNNRFLCYKLMLNSIQRQVEGDIKILNKFNNYLNLNYEFYQRLLDVFNEWLEANMIHLENIETKAKNLI